MFQNVWKIILVLSLLTGLGLIISGGKEPLPSKAVGSISTESDPQTTPTATPGITVLPKKQWKKKQLTGSGALLKGRTLLISIYLNTEKCKWTKKAKKQEKRKLKAATAYLTKQAKKYDQQVEFITAVEEPEDLTYLCEIKKNPYQDFKAVLYMMDRMEKYVENKINTTLLRERYQTNNIGFLVHVNGTGLSQTMVHYMDYKASQFYEVSVLYHRYDGKLETAATMAHEILHLYGARDLYEANGKDGISRKLVKYVKKHYSRDLMFCNLVEKKIYRIQKYKVTPISAYFVGWLDTVKEIKKFPKMKPRYPGCFGTVAK